MESPKGYRVAECSRCGLCCIKGGPALHLSDKDLIDSGTLPASHLFTIRKGEPVTDNVEERLTHAESDIIKLKGRDASFTCIYFDTSEKKCRIYNHRPLECRILKCWDTREIEAVYSKNRLSRRILLEKSHAVWQLVQAHESYCSYEKILPLIRENRENRPSSMSPVLRESLAYDCHLRSVLVKEGKMNPKLIDFIIGRPLTLTLKAFW